MIAIPPLSFFLTVIFGGFLFSRIPNASSSDSMIFLSPRGLSTSRTINMRLHVRATAGRGGPQLRRCPNGRNGVPAITALCQKDGLSVVIWHVPWRPRPRPSFAPSMIPAAWPFSSRFKHAQDCTLTQIEDLDGRSMHFHRARNRRECCEVNR